MSLVEYDFYDADGNSTKKKWNPPKTHQAWLSPFLEAFVLEREVDGVEQQKTLIVGGDGNEGDPDTWVITSTSIDPPDYGEIEVIGIWDPETGETFSFDSYNQEVQFTREVHERLSEWVNEEMISRRNQLEIDKAESMLLDADDF